MACHEQEEGGVAFAQRLVMMWCLPCDLARMAKCSTNYSELLRTPLVLAVQV